MNLITFTFNIPKEDLKKFMSDIEAMSEFWDARKIEVSLFKDQQHLNRFMLMFSTAKNVDEIVDILQKEPQAKQCFDHIKQFGSRVLVSALEQIL
jgi:hypothetical protein